MDSKFKAQEVKKKVSIPMYFYNIIVPQISDYYSDYPVDFDIRPVACCPLHDEITPSMRYYEETNTFYCFGCRAGGDVIELHSRFTERINGAFPTFEESVDFLYNYFVDGKVTTAVITTANGNGIVYESTVVNVMRLSKYISNLEDSLLMDNSILEDSKKEIWAAIDVVKTLISLNKAEAVECMNYIRGIVKRNIK